MPKDEFDPADPMELVGMQVPADAGTLQEMARCFVEEFVRMGYTDDQILAMCRQPFYAGAHLIWHREGEASLRALLTAERAKWGSEG